jgi:hypothetical protein
MMDLPEPLFESFVEGKKLCLVCAKKQATQALWTVSKPIVPLCADCWANWSFYGYAILRKIKPANLISGIMKYKLLHPFQGPSLAGIWRDVTVFKEWARKMKKFM